MGSPELERILRREWAHVHAFVAAVHEMGDIYPKDMPRKEVHSVVMQSQYIEHHPKDAQLIRFTADADDFWEALSFSDSIRRLGG